MPPEKRPRADDSTDPITISVSSSIHDRKSTFLALYTPSATTNALADLRGDSRLDGADHRIAAWRRPSNQKSLYPGAAVILEPGWDDDGEKHGGRRVLSVLESLQVGGTLVVGRWWGGIMLGPVRFTHIEKCGKDAVQAALAAVDANKGPAAKKLKEDGLVGEGKSEAELRAECQKLARDLGTRDQNIRILRSLRDEKRAKLEARKKSADPEQKDEPAEGTPAPSQGTPHKEPPKLDYDTMPLATLRRLESARDKSIAFVLAEIERLETELGENGEGNEVTESPEQS